MSVPDRLPDEALDGLLDGSASQEAAGTPLAAYLAELRDDAQATTPTPSEELSVVLAEGLDPAELGAGAAVPSEDAGRRGILTWRRRARTMGRVLVTKLAALGLLGKAAAAGAAVTVAASGAGAAGVLPDPVQHTFDEAIGREVQEAPAETEDEPGGADDGAEVETPPETPADTSTTGPLDTDVSDDATGSADDEPGVDGQDVAEDASDGQSEAGEEPPAEEAPRNEAPDEAPAGSERGEESVQDAPTDDTPEDVPPTESPAADEQSAADGDDRPTADDADDRPGESSSSTTSTDGTRSY